MRVSLSSCTIPDTASVRRTSPRPIELRNDRYEQEFDWQTLFYDVFRVGKHVVFQGPPFLGLIDPLKKSSFFRGHLGLFTTRRAHVKRNGANELWLRGAWEEIEFDGPLGYHKVAVQPSMHNLFDGRRVMLTVSKDNDIRWIKDWVAFHVHVHGANAVLIYDNASLSYTCEDLQRALQEHFPEITILVVGWPFKWGAAGGGSGAVGNKPAPWDSEFCQIGALQHARFRFLGRAKSVLNCDIDELVVSSEGLSVFEAAERARDGIVEFDGRWVENYSSSIGETEPRRHFHFHHYAPDSVRCPPKWCVRPSALNRRRHTWSIHTIQGRDRQSSDNRFLFRHFRALSNNWKWNRWTDEPASGAGLHLDSELIRALDRSGIGRGSS